MMTVLNCVSGQHDLWLVALAVVVCVSGCWVTLRLFLRAAATAGAQHFGWLFLTGVAGGASIWCTHFIAMLGYDPRVPVTFDPVLTTVSLLIAIGGTTVAFAVATSGFTRVAPALGGALVGLAISAMHYTGMAAYRVDGLVAWDGDYLAASLVLAAAFGALALEIALRPNLRAQKVAAVGLLVAAIVSLHFTAMTAFQVTPLALHPATLDAAGMQGVAMSIALVGLVIVGAGLSSYLIDVRTRSDAYERFRYLSLHDPLTGLPNRASFSDYLDGAIEFGRRSGRHIAAIAIDLDSFKEVNDLRGHKVGDEILRTLGQRLYGCVGEGEYAARIGGDEFAAVKDFRDRHDLDDFVARLEAVLLAPVRVDDIDTATGACLGIAIYPEDGESRDALVNNANLALSRAKSDTTRNVCFFEPSMDEATRSQRALGKDLQKALRNGEFDVHYQAQCSVRTGEIRGYEALLRWQHPVHGAIAPSVFVPLAEENGLILELGEWVLRRACTTAAAWEPACKVAVNVSAVQLAHGDLPQLVHRVLRETGLKPALLELELTESTLMKDKDRAIGLLRRMRALGVSIALDDFGAGHSSLGILRTFPFDKIKLDSSFVSELEDSPQAKAVVRAVLALGKSLGVPVLAEGIETDRQLAILRQEGCDEFQGFLHGRPVPFVPVAVVAAQ